MSGSTDCQGWERLLRGDDHARLTPERVSSLRAHLQVCAECHARHAVDLELIDALAHVPPVTPPPWTPPRSSWRRAIPIAAAAILLVLVRFPAPAPTRIAPASATPIAAVFRQVERRFQLGRDEAEPYVITTTYHSVINHKP